MAFASCSTVSMAAMPSLAKKATPTPTPSKQLLKPLNTLPLPSKATRFQVKASSSIKEKAVTGLTAAAVTASMMMIPQVAEAAESGVSPSLKNFLLSILAGGVVLSAILGAIIAVSNFDPVKRT